MELVTDEAALADAIKRANGPVSVRGGGTRGIKAEGEVLSTTGLSGITLFEPGALTLVAQAGTPVADIEAALAKENQRLAFEPMDHRALLGTDGIPTIGGVIAGNISGPRRIQVGAARDFALGIRMVDGMGQLIKNGGRVMKNVTGYDLVKLMSGSWGTLGVLSEVSLKVLPIPETQATLVLHGQTPEDAVASMSAALGAPYDVSGAAYDANTKSTLIRLEGFEDSVRYRAEQVQTRLPGAEFRDAEASAKAWLDIRDVTALADMDGDVWRISVKPTDGPRVLQAVQPTGAIMDWGGGLVWACVPQDTNLRAKLGDIPGHATLVRASAETKVRLGVFHPQPLPVAMLATGLRTKFDPRGILNPGLMTETEAA